MIKVSSLLLFLFLGYCSFCQIPLKDHVFQLNEFNDQLNINDILKKEEAGLFNVPFKIETYKFIKNKEANWIKINIPKQQEKQYISIENSMFEEIEFYLVNENGIKTPTNLWLQKEYRFPIVKITKEDTPAKLFIKTKDKYSYRTEFILKNYNKPALNATMQRDYFAIGGFLISMIVLLVATCVFFTYKKKPAILWFGAHLILMFIEYLISTGTFSQWFIPNEIIMKWGLDHISLMLSCTSLMLFYRDFYPFNSKTRYIKKVFLIIAIATTMVAILAIIDGFLGNTLNVEWFSQNLLDLASLTVLITYIILTYYKIIPVYLFIAFLLPIIGIITNTGNIKELVENPIITYIMFQAVYYGILIETMVIIFYIMKTSVDGELKAIELEEENSKLKIDFNERLNLNQEKHKNELLNDVHDSFGGYIEALKLTFINKKINDTSIEKILNSFSKEYRLLLNSLYIPNINPENFINAIQEYCDKMNSVSDIEVKFNYTKDNFIEIPQNIAKFIFKASSELVTNAIKYSKANFIDVNLNLNQHLISIKINDDGVGFDKNNTKNTSYGIKGIRERVKIFNGEINIESNKNRGTCIRIKLPIPENINT